MLKFFRQLRYSLLENGKSIKYLKYAIGEIILVVIGILIALQINNWNENRKSRSDEAVLLQNVISDLDKDLSIHNQIDNSIKSIISLNNSIEDYIKGNVQEDSIVKVQNIRRYLIFTPVTITNHPNLANNVSDENLKNLVRSYYQDISSLIFTIDLYNSFQESEMRSQLREELLLNYHFDTNISTDDLIYRDKFILFLDNPRFHQTLFEWKIRALTIRNALSNVLDSHNELKKLVINITETN